MSLKAFQESLCNPEEIGALFQFQFSSNNQKQKLKDIKCDTERKCFEYLYLTSRSFAAVIHELDVELRLPICLFYLILRGLDTIEDDMTIPVERKVELLATFHELIYQPGWSFHENGKEEKDRILLQDFGVVIAEFLKLKVQYQEVIADITKKMGNGMAEFLNKTVDTLEDWDLYCHYVAGLVGHGLTRLMGLSGLEDHSLAENLELANSMGLFLQKVNIIRDYHEDLLEGRIFWPKEIWSKYVDKIEDLRLPENKEKAMLCLDDLCLNVLGHAADCLKYMSLLRNNSCFNFCAIPQVMAISTIALVCNNYNIYQQNVKIRKGLAVKLILESTDMITVQRIFNKFAHDVIQNVDPKNPRFLDYSTWYGKLSQNIRNNKYASPLQASPSSSSLLLPSNVIFPVIFGIISYLVFKLIFV